MTNEEIQSQIQDHIDFFKNDPETLRMIGNSKLCAAVGIRPDDTDTIRMFTEVLLRKMHLMGELDRFLV